MVQQLGRCRITATSFWIQTTTNCPRLRPLTNKSTFLPNPSLGSWNHTGLQDHHLPHSSPAVSQGFLFPALFHHPAANPKMIFNWLKSTKPPKRVGISLGVPRAPETLLISGKLISWQPALGRSCLVSGLAPWKALRVTLFPAPCWDREFCSSPSWISSQKLFQLQALPREGLQLHGSSELCWQEI